MILIKNKRINQKINKIKKQITIYDYKHNTNGTTMGYKI